MTQHLFTFDLVARGQPGLSSLWWVELASAESVEVVASLEFMPGMRAWRLRARSPLPPAEASWSHPADRSQRPRLVPAWLQREVIAQLAAWSIGHLRSLARVRVNKEGAS